MSLASCRAIAAVIALVAMTMPLRAQEPAQKLYEQKCARCHGKTGEGTKEYRPPLVGNRALPQLTRYISRAMPEDDPGTLSAAESEAVAKYIFDAFYSPAAQAKIKPQRVELARLTVAEYRNALADVVGGFGAAGGAAKPSGKADAGLRAEYFNSEKRNRTLAFKRVDPVINIDFAADDDDFKKLKTEELAANWQGSLLAPETGTYDFLVRTEHSTRLWVNDLKKPLIDASVKSGNETEFRGSIFLLGGRTYPVKLEFSRATLGVRKDPKEKRPPPKSTIALEWKPPRRASDLVPSFQLKPETTPTSFAPSLNLPADDRSAGYERGTAVSKEWVQAVTDGAIETSTYIIDHLPELSGVKNDAKDRRKLLMDYCTKLAERAFRRPLTAEQKALYIERQFEAAKDEETAVKRVVLLVLQSPRFLYREPLAGDAFDTASRLSFGLWDSPPDAALLDAAANGKLTSRDDVVREASRMLADPRARAKIRGILLGWLKVDQVAELSKDPEVFPEFTPKVASDLQTSLELFVDDVVWSDASDYRQFFRSDSLFLNGRLAAIYGGDLPPDAAFQKVTPKPGERSGVVTHPYLMATFSYTATSSPIHRGVFLARNILGVPMRPPPDAFTPLPPELHPKLSTRERITLQTSAKDCKSCHGIINPLGFPLENFDAIGRFRDREKEKPIDATGSFQTRSGDIVRFRSSQELANFLAGSDEAHEAFVARLFHNLVKQPILAYGPEKLSEMRRRFVDNQYSVRQLVIEIMAETALARKTP